MHVPVVHLVDASDQSAATSAVVPCEVYLDGHLMPQAHLANLPDEPTALLKERVSDGLAFNGVDLEGGPSPIISVLAHAADVEYDPDAYILRWDGIDLCATEHEHLTDTGVETLDGHRLVVLRFFASSLHIVGAQDAPKAQEPAYA